MGSHCPFDTYSSPKIPYFRFSLSNLARRGLPKRKRVNAVEMLWSKFTGNPAVKHAKANSQDKLLLMVKTVHRSKRGPTTRTTEKKPKLPMRIL